MPETDPVIPPIHTTIEVHDQLPPDYKAEEKLRTQGQKESGWFAALWAAFYAAVVDGVGTILELMAAMANLFLARFGKVVARAQGEDSPEFYDLLATVIWDLTGVEVDATALKTAVFGRGRLPGMDRIGAEIFNLLANEFVKPDAVAGVGAADSLFGTGIGGLPDYPLSPEQGVKAARRFLGFLMSFSIREGNMALLGEVCSLGVIETYGDYAKELANNLSLGRLARHAYRPLIDVLIATPCEWAMNKQYRPKLLGEGTAVRAFLRGALTLEQLREELALQGYSDERINSVIAVNEQFLTDTDLSRLVIHKDITEDQAVAHLRRRGYTPEVARWILRANDLASVDSLTRRRADFYERQALEGFLSFTDFEARVRSMPLSELERATRVGNVAAYLSQPRKQLTLTQMRSAYVRNHVTLGEYRRFLRVEGYSADDELILVLDALDVKNALDEKQKAAAERAALNAITPTGPTSGTP